MTDTSVELTSLKSSEIKNINVIENINGKEVIIKQYLPVNDKLNLISKIVSLAVSANEYNFVNPVQLDVFSLVEIIKAYTNITIAEDMLPADAYDILVSEGILSKVLDRIPANEYNFVSESIQCTIEAYYNHKNSALGILEAVSQDYSNLELDASAIQEKIADPDNLTLLKDVMTKLG